MTPFTLYFVLLTALSLLPISAHSHLPSSQSTHFATQPPSAFHILLHSPYNKQKNPPATPHDFANPTILLNHLRILNDRVRKNGGETKKEFDVGKRRIVRVPRFRLNGAKEAGRLIGMVSGVGFGWEGRMGLGGQWVNVGIDMLSSDFVVYETTAGTGYEKGNSENYLSTTTHISPSCVLASDHLTLLHNPSSNVDYENVDKTSSRIPFTHCNPHRATLDTLHPSGAVWGLAFPSISQTGQPSLLSHLYETTPLIPHGQQGEQGEGASKNSVLRHPIWSFAYVSPNEAILTIGGTVLDFAPENEWKWTSLKDQVEGYWQVNIQSISVEGIKVLQGISKVILDVSSGMIAGPGEMVEVIWSVVQGARRLWEVVDEDDNTEGGWWKERDGEKGEWWVFPCLNEPMIKIEFAGWGFPVEKIGLGRVAEGSGYCVGGIVGWPRGEKEDEERVWVLGQPYWAGIVGVFDFEKRKVGMRTT